VAELLDVPINSVERKKSRLKHGWAEIPEWVFCSEIGGFLDGRNLTRTWHRVRRKGQKEGFAAFVHYQRVDLWTEPEAHRLRGRSHNGANGLGDLRLVHRPGELA
jgi:hypothetical protein